MSSPDQSGLFREKAVSSIDSVERFDEAISIVSSRSVFALATIGILLLAVLAWAFLGSVPVGLQGRGIIVTGSGVQPVVATAAGTLIALPGQVGDEVRPGDAVARLRTMDGRVVALRAQAQGTLAQRSAQVGSFVRAGDTVGMIEQAGVVPTAVVFVPVETDRRVAPGMQVHISPGDTRPDVFGFLLGHVTYVAVLPATPDRIKDALENDAVVAGFPPDVPVREVHIALDVDSHGSFVWSGFTSARRGLSAGMPCYATIVVEERRPIAFVLPQSG